MGGLSHLSSCDWPGELVATVFCQGCPWDCPYCHNPGLRAAQGDEAVPWPEVTRFLAGRSGLLDGVVFSGGEPTAQPALLAAVAEIGSMGFRVGLHTGGPYPERLAALLPHLDWVGFDVKAPFKDYGRVTGQPASGHRALSSLRLLMASGVAYQVRTTTHPALLSGDDLGRLEDELVGLGVTNHVFQLARTTGCRPAFARLLMVPMDG